MTPANDPIQSVEQELIPRIDHGAFVTVRLPFVHPFGTSVQVWTHKEALLLRLTSGQTVAWGECVADPDPFYMPETTQTARHIIRDFLLPLVEPGLSMGELVRRFTHCRGHGMAKATVENALLNLIALQKQIPLHDLLGAPAKPIMSGVSIGLQDSMDELLGAVAKAVSRNYHRVKIKIERGRDVEWVRRVRDRFPDLQLMVDANGAFTLDDAPLLKQLDAFHLSMIEQPLSYADIHQHALLQRSLETPLCLDESILGLDEAVAAVALGACRILNIKQGRVGGLIPSMRIARFAAEHGVGVWSGGMDETGIGRAVNIHLQTTPGFTIPGDTSETCNYFEEDIIDKPVTLDPEGYIAIPEGSGLGVNVLPDRLMHSMVDWELIR
jgi:O-succinylbenzoate synthase